jgi:hypothetical protein
MCEGGRDLEGMELVEYCDNLFFDAYEVGRCKIDRREGGDVISGGNGGWFGFEDGEDTGDEEVAGETVSIVGDMTAAILVGRPLGSSITGAKSPCQPMLFRSMMTNWRKLASKPWELHQVQTLAPELL